MSIIWNNKQKMEFDGEIDFSDRIDRISRTFNYFFKLVIIIIPLLRYLLKVSIRISSIFSGNWKKTPY